MVPLPLVGGGPARIGAFVDPPDCGISTSQGLTMTTPAIAAGATATDEGAIRYGKPTTIG
jgi:hypothetical protein